MLPILQRNGSACSYPHINAFLQIGHWQGVNGRIGPAVGPAHDAKPAA